MGEANGVRQAKPRQQARQARVGCRARLAVDRDGGLVSVMALDIADGQIQCVSSIVNPDKLGHLGRIGEMWPLLGPREG